MRTMLICHSPEGRIQNIVFDPIPPGMQQHYSEQGILFAVIESELDGTEIATEFFVGGDGMVVERPEFDAPAEITIVADGSVQATLILPDPCAIMVDGEAQTITGGSLPLASDMPAEYLIELVQWPYIKKTVKVVANAPV